MKKRRKLVVVDDNINGKTCLLHAFIHTKLNSIRGTNYFRNMYRKYKSGYEKEEVHKYMIIFSKKHFI